MVSTGLDPAVAELERDFHVAMLDIYRRSRAEANYKATYFLQMVERDGGPAAARKLLAASRPSEGFTALWERSRLDLTVEAAILEPRFAELFTDTELELARHRLEQYGYRICD